MPLRAAMARLEALLSRHRRLVLVAWVALVAASLPFALQQSQRLTGGGFDVPGSQSERVERIISHELQPKDRAVVLGGLLQRGRGATRADVAGAFDRLAAAVKRTPGISLNPKAREYALLEAQGRRTVIVPFVVSVDEFHAPDVAREVRARLGLDHGLRVGGVSVHLVGAGALWAAMVDLTKHDLAQAELIGFPLLLVILLAVFGSLTAAVLPLALGAASVAITGALVYLLSHAITMDVYVPNVASMIGLGVAVDYSLFVLARYRQEIAAGRPPREARAIAMSSSGIAVLFSGATVVASLAGLFLMPTAALRSLALGAIIVVLVSVLAAVTLLPALIALLGRHAQRGRRWDAGGGFRRWSDAVMRRPALALALSLALLLVLATPTLFVHTGDSALAQFPSDSPELAAFRAAAKVTGVGSGAPVKILMPRADSRKAARIARNDPEVTNIGRALPTRDGRRALMLALARHRGDSDQAKALVRRLRRKLPAGTLVGGDTAAQVDFDAATSGTMWQVALFVAAIGFLLLTLLLRSLVVPLKAVLTTLLSVGVAYGVLVAIFQWGWLDGLLGIHTPGYLDTVVMPVVLVVVFGLSMDYEVFLLTRIRERYDATGDPRRAVAEGVVASARAITSAAAIMVAVFAAFIATGVPVIKEIGLGDAVAIALDATLVRLVLVPAAMALLGHASWWLPARVRRLLEPGGRAVRPGPA